METSLNPAKLCPADLISDYVRSSHLVSRHFPRSVADIPYLAHAECSCISAIFFLRYLYPGARDSFLPCALSSPDFLSKLLLVHRIHRSVCGLRGGSGVCLDWAH